MLRNKAFISESSWLGNNREQLDHMTISILEGRQLRDVRYTYQNWSTFSLLEEV